MGILLQFAQSGLNTYNDSYYTTSNGTGDDAAASAWLILITMFIVFIFAIGIYIIVSLSLVQIFKKAGVKPWVAWVPYYNNWKLLEIGGQQGFWAILLAVPVASIIATIVTFIAMYHIGKKLGKDSYFIILGILLPLVWFIWLAVDSSKWNDKASSAPSLHKG